MHTDIRDKLSDARSNEDMKKAVLELRHRVKVSNIALCELIAQQTMSLSYLQKHIQFVLYL